MIKIWIKNNKRQIEKFVDIFFSLAVGQIILVSLPGLVFEVSYLNRIYPGIRIGNVDVGGLTKTQALEKINRVSQGLKSINLVWGVNNWRIEGKDIGLNYLSDNSVQKALLIGRTGSVLTDSKQKLDSVTGKINILPSYDIDKFQLEDSVASVAAQIDVPAKEPSVTIDSLNQVSVSPGENGQKTDQILLLRKIADALATFSVEKVTIPVVLTKPKLSDSQMDEAEKKAQKVLGKSLVINYGEDNKKWTINQDQLLVWMDLQTGGWKSDQIEKWIGELATTIDRPPQNASFKFEDGKVKEFKPAREGKRVEQDRMRDLIVNDLDKAVDDQRDVSEVNLITSSIPPEISTSQVNTFGINERLGMGESWLSGSITNRIFNMQKAAEAVNGTLVPPGEVFSFNKTIGEVSGDTGYKQAYIIKDGKTILGDGGGVCQVSTTLFRAVLNAGLPVVARTAHAYRVSYYEQNYQPGFDATVFQPNPDFEFKNDTGAYILVQAKYNESEKHLVFELYGTSDGRKATVSKARIWDVTPPPPDVYQDDPTLPVGKIVQTEHAAWGAKVAFDWKVVRGDQVLQQRTFYSNYQPWQAVFLRGTKTQ